MAANRQENTQAKASTQKAGLRAGWVGGRAAVAALPVGRSGHEEAAPPAGDADECLAECISVFR